MTVTGKKWEKQERSEERLATTQELVFHVMISKIGCGHSLVVIVVANYCKSYWIAHVQCVLCI